ncbi:alpha-amylase [Cryomorpha ignava]|uniref:Alpha-amylase n=1 Tax=Cryomorpha ignava TaxID=101383 RepID=A0A7K3WLJ8_9FLAO|nr:alpha-amylase family glycosyl hydrolase [Cryomorpha ignava]NEN22526.1 alpha-amylase [Cryomorpha ignava]
MKNTFLVALICCIAASCGNAPKEKSESESMEKKADTVSHAEWSKNATIYEVNIRQYTPEGTFSAFGESLPRLKDMGVKILWLMPINPIGEKNRKGTKGSYYSVRDYKGINPEFGNLDDFKLLVKEAHDLDMKVIIDWVANHSAFDNVWTETNKDWYELDSVGALMPPHGTDWWDVAQLNYDNAEMRLAMIDAMQYWLKEADIDGFRCDVAEMVPMDFWITCRDSLDKTKPGVFMLAEGQHPELHQAFDMTYAFEFLHLMNGIAKGEKELSEIDSFLKEEKVKYSPEDYRMFFTTSHDENSWNGTVFERYGKGHKVFATLAFTIAGMPMVYSGQEAGLDYALEFFEKDSIKWGDIKLNDFYSKLLNLNRENKAMWNGEYGGELTRLKTDADEAVYAFSRKRENNEVVVICNLKDTYVKTKFDSVPSGDFKPLFDQESLELIGKNGLELAPYGFHVFYR